MRACESAKEEDKFKLKNNKTSTDNRFQTFLLDTENREHSPFQNEIESIFGKTVWLV